MAAAKSRRKPKAKNKAAAHLAGDLNKAKKTEADKLQAIKEAAFRKGQRMAARAVARRQGFESGLRSAGLR